MPGQTGPRLIVTKNIVKKKKSKYLTDNSATTNMLIILMKSPFFFIWVDLSKRNGSRPELIFTCNNSNEDVLHSSSHGRKCFSGSQRAQKVHSKQKAHAASYM